jgi:hypothetical protein
MAGRIKNDHQTRSLSGLTPARLSQARSDLMRIGLIAYQHPLYQVLSLDSPPRSEGCELGADEIRIKRVQTTFSSLPASMQSWATAPA